MSNTDTPGVNPEIQNADGDSAGNKKVRGNIGVDHGVEVVEKERAAIGRRVTKYRKPLFQRRERAPEAKDFDDYSVHQRGNVQRGEPRPVSPEEGRRRPKRCRLSETTERRHRSLDDKQ